MYYRAGPCGDSPPARARNPSNGAIAFRLCARALLVPWVCTNFGRKGPENLRLRGQASGAGAFSLRTVESFEAWGGFRGVYGGLALARGERCKATPGRIGLFGAGERPAVLDMGGMALRSQRLELDLERFLIESDRGELVAADGKPQVSRGGQPLFTAQL